jgi:hypothetical protein
MSDIGRRVVHQRGIVVALITSALILVVLIVQRELGILLSILGAVATGSLISPSDYGWSALFTVQAVTLDLAFAVGVLLSLWLIAPIAAELRLFHVFTRSLLAAAVGAALLAVVEIAISIYGAFSGPLMAMTSFSGPRALQGVLFGIADAGRYFVSSAPLVILAGVLLWIWLERHPRDHGVAGIVDEV